MTQHYRLAALCVALSLAFAGGQASAADAAPAAFKHSLRPLAQVAQELMPAVDVAALAREDATRRASDLPPRFAAPIAVGLSPAKAGTWEELDAQNLIWRLRISSPGAYSINLGFTRYFMPEGGRLLVYPAGLRANSDPSLVRSFDAKDNAEHGELWTPMISSSKSSCPSCSAMRWNWSWAQSTTTTAASTASPRKSAAAAPRMRVTYRARATST
jgi:lysyl endopeptidase